MAIKIIDIDKFDYEEYTSDNMQVTIKEINILKQLRREQSQALCQHH